MLSNPNYIRYIFTLTIFLCLVFSNTISAGEKKAHSNLTKGVFLIASDQLQHSPLAKAVIYITQHDDAGTSGFIINQPTDLLINQAFPDMQASQSTNKTLYFGGPLHSKYLFMLTQTQFGHGLHLIRDEIYFGAGDEVKVRLRSNNKRDKIRTYAGFMSWGPNQVDSEVDIGDWVITPASNKQLFSDDTTDLWKVLYRRWAGSWI